MILRQSTRETDWDGATLSKDVSIVVFAPYFHRDDDLPFAHSFAPELSTQAEGDREVRTAADGPIALVPFSYGPGRCPASNLVPMLGSAMLAALVAARTPELAHPARLDEPLPGTLDNYTLSFRLTPRAA